MLTSISNQDAFNNIPQEDIEAFLDKEFDTKIKELKIILNF